MSLLLLLQPLNILTELKKQLGVHFFLTSSAVSSCSERVMEGGRERGICCLRPSKSKEVYCVNNLIAQKYVWRYSSSLTLALPLPPKVFYRY